MNRFVWLCCSKESGGGGVGCPKVCQVCFHRYSCSIITADPRGAEALWWKGEPLLCESSHVWGISERWWCMISQRSCGCRTLGFYFLPKSYIWSKGNHFLLVNAAQDPINIQQCFCCGPSPTKNAHSTWGSVQIGLRLLKGDRESRPNYHPLDSTTKKNMNQNKT